MIKHKTVLVLGAGASRPYGLPLGQELRDAVIKVYQDIPRAPLPPRVDICEAEYGKFATILAESGYPSVDAFLEDHQEWMSIGKAAMALCLLRSEWKSRWKIFPPGQPRDHWYEALWAKLKAPSWEGFKRNLVDVVTFNYDRSLEHYLVRLLCNNYGLTQSTVCRQLPILHVHGSLGEYEAYPFGGRITQEVHRIAARSIRVVHESDIAGSEFGRAQQLIRDAQQVILIGFGYHEGNMNKLGMNCPQSPGRLRLGTHKGIRAMEWRRLCLTYRISGAAYRGGAGSIGEFLTECLD